MSNASLIQQPRPGGTGGQSAEAAELGCPAEGWRRRLFIIVFESETPAGRTFDLALLLVIVASVLVVMLDSLTVVTGRLAAAFNVLEWVFTALFTAEYVARLVCVERPLRYARSFFGVVDLLAVLPAYIAFFLPGAHVLIDVRVLRLLRVFRILKLAAYIREYGILARALKASGRKILIFVSTVFLIVILLGTVMYVVEGPENGFTSIPLSIYWAVTTITTVGFGDITPKTDLGRTISAFMMLLGWGILAVPTGIVTAELSGQRAGAHPPESRALTPAVPERRCGACGSSGHRIPARYCQDCGAPLSGSA